MAVQRKQGPPTHAQSVTRTYRAAIKFGESYITLEESITLGVDASDAEIAQAVELGWRIYQAQHAAVERQVAALGETWGTAGGAPITIRDPEAPASDRQVQLIRKLRNDLGWSDGQLADLAAEQGVPPDRLTMGQASSLIDALQRQVGGQVCTEKQLDALGKLADASSVALDEVTLQRFGVAASALTRQQAADLIKDWQPPARQR